MENLGTHWVHSTRYKDKKRQNKKHNTAQTTKTMRNTDRTKHRRWKQVLAIGKQFLPLIGTNHVTHLDAETCWTTLYTN